jgi:hypothetical protein
VYERVDVVTSGQRMHLEAGFHFDWWCEADYPFRDEEHRRSTWAVCRGEIMAEWLADVVGNAGRRPEAHWQYDHELKPDRSGYPIWPRGIKNEAHAVLKMCNPSAVERAEIEERGLARSFDRHGNWIIPDARAAAAS